MKYQPPHIAAAILWALLALAAILWIIASVQSLLIEGIAK